LKFSFKNGCLKENQKVILNLFFKPALIALGKWGNFSLQCSKSAGLELRKICPRKSTLLEIDSGVILDFLGVFGIAK
tara:strand:- start:408 stop:638 length:231 start_codon:yes stop_codon:yes gene_type:complete